MPGKKYFEWILSLEYHYINVYGSKIYAEPTLLLLLLLQMLQKGHYFPPQSIYQFIISGDTMRPDREVNQEVESKLAAFKQRLKQSSQVHFTPAPQPTVPSQPSTVEQKVNFIIKFHLLRELYS